MPKKLSKKKPTKKKKAKKAQDLKPTAVLSTFRDPLTSDFDNAWLGIEPTFQTRKSVRKWMELAKDEEGEEAYFTDPYMLGTLKEVAAGMVKSWRKRRAKDDPACFFDSVERTKELDQWETERHILQFKWQALAK